MFSKYKVCPSADEEKYDIKEKINYNKHIYVYIYNLMFMWISFYGG